MPVSRSVREEAMMVEHGPPAAAVRPRGSRPRRLGKGLAKLNGGGEVWPCREMQQMKLAIPSGSAKAAGPLGPPWVHTLAPGAASSGQKGSAKAPRPLAIGIDKASSCGEVDG